MAEWRNRSLVIKDNFRDWGVLHKSVVLLLAGFAFVAAVRLVITNEAGQFKVEAVRELPYSADLVWAWVVFDQNRARWQAELTELVKLKGDPGEVGSTRLLFYRRADEKWTATELTQDVTAYEQFKTYQESDRAQRTLNARLETVGPCRSRLTMTEVIYHKDFSTRYWAFHTKSDARERLEISLDALEKWLGQRGGECPA